MAGASVIVSSPSEWLGIFPVRWVRRASLAVFFVGGNLKKCRANSSSNETIHPGSPAADAWQRSTKEEMPAHPPHSALVS